MTVKNRKPSKMVVSGILNSVAKHSTYYPTPLALTNSNHYTMHYVILQILIFTVAFALVSSVDFLDLFHWGDQDDHYLQRRGAGEDVSSLTNCQCDGPSCICCVDYNISYIDLGGPGCVRMKYISQQEGIAVNVSYGESLLHSDQVKGPNPEPTCMALLVNLAHVCARFSNLESHNDGLRGCLLLEPKLLGDVTASFDIGCFTMGPKGMTLENPPNSTSTAEGHNQNGTQSESSVGLNEEELIAAVNESAEQSLVFFGQLLGLTFGKPDSNATDTKGATPGTDTSNETSKQ